MTAEITLTEVLSIMNEAFQRLEDSIQALTLRFDRLEARVERLEIKVEKIEKELGFIRGMVMTTQSQVERLVVVLETNQVITPYETGQVLAQPVTTTV